MLRIITNQNQIKLHLTQTIPFFFYLSQESDLEVSLTAIYSIKITINDAAYDLF